MFILETSQGVTHSHHFFKLIPRAFSFIFQAPPILRVSKFAPQEYEDESQKYSR